MLALYHNDMSLCAQKVRVGLAEKGLEWESRHLVLRAAEHQQPWYLELNRRAVVPTLIDGEKVIPESNVILEYLDESYPDALVDQAARRGCPRRLSRDSELRHRLPASIS
jgi:glutathione S-transferase